jgi:predicted nucleic acid-binding Zn ribbon protein
MEDETRVETMSLKCPRCGKAVSVLCELTEPACLVCEACIKSASEVPQHRPNPSVC